MYVVSEEVFAGGDAQLLGIPMQNVQSRRKKKREHVIPRDMPLSPRTFLYVFQTEVREHIRVLKQNMWQYLKRLLGDFGTYSCVVLLVCWHLILSDGIYFDDFGICPFFVWKTNEFGVWGNFLCKLIFMYPMHSPNKNGGFTWSKEMEVSQFCQQNICN